MIIDVIKRTAVIEVRIGPRGRPGQDGGGSGASLPEGGTTGQVLAKQSNADGDADWQSLGGAAALNVGTTSGTVCAGDDMRLTNNRAPTAHTHPQSDITGLTDSLASKADLVGGKVPSSQIPSIALTEFLGPVSSQSAMILLTGQPGDYCFRTDVGIAFFLISGTGSSVGNWHAVSTPATSGVVSVNGQDGVVVLSAADIGLDQVDNTSDADKPVSTAVQGQLDTKIGIDNPTVNNNLTIAGADPFLTLQRDSVQQRFLSNPAGSLDYTSPAEAGVILTDASTIQGSQIADETVANAKLENSSITINGTPVSLGGSISVSPGTVAYSSISGRPLFLATITDKISSTPTLDDLMTVSIPSAGTWGFEATGLLFTSNAGEGASLAVNGPSASAINAHITIPTNGTGGCVNGSVSAWNSKVNTVNMVLGARGRWFVSGVATVTAAGPLSIRFSAETSSFSATIPVGATLRVFPL